MHSFTSMIVLILTILLASRQTMAFTMRSNSFLNTATISSNNALFSIPPPRQPRRMLKKRRNRERIGKSLNTDDSFPWETAESRPLISSTRREAGEDYWIDEKDYESDQLRQQAIKNRKAMEGEITKDKLWGEIKAPYKQNWIGYFSMGILMISAIVIKFPELLDSPLLQIPDL